MAAVLESIRDSSTPENLTESIFKWVVANIVYDKSHGRFFYRTARETYNDGHGICGELSVLYMAFLRAAGIGAAFVEVKKDQKGDDVSHACVLVKQGSSWFLSDPAYRCFVVEHVEWIEWSDERLSAQYRSWNR
jgi:transglutaminase-like putative cysteine protease